MALANPLLASATTVTAAPSINTTKRRALWNTSCGAQHGSGRLPIPASWSISPDRDAVFAWIRCSQERRRALKSGDRNLATLAGGLQASLGAFAVGGTFLSFQYVEMLWHFFALSSATYHLTEARSSQPVPESGASAYSAAYPATALS